MYWPPFDETKPETWPPTAEAPFGFTRKGNPRIRARPTVKGHSALNSEAVREGKRQAEADVRELFPDGAPQPRVNVPPPGKPTFDVDGKLMDLRSRQIVKVRMGKRWNEITQRVRAGEFTWDEFCEELDPEELARGQLRDTKGKWTGRPPEFVPKAFHNACMRQIKKRFDDRLMANLEAATDGLISLGTNEEVDPATRARILQYLIERVMGKVPDKVVVSHSDPWEEIVSGIVSEVEDKAIANAQDYLSRTESMPTEGS